jgi:hypothetical protein
MVGIDPVDGDQNVVFHPMLLEQSQAPHDPVKSGLALFV